MTPPDEGEAPDAPLYFVPAMKNKETGTYKNAGCPLTRIIAE